MLRKLLKYELKATGRIFLPLFLALLVFAAINRFTLSLDKFDAPAIISGISMFIYIIIMVGMFAMTFIMTIQRFNKNLLSDEGYLMSTLPVKPWKHIVSKLFVSMLWMVASGIVALISILIIALKKGAFTQFTEVFATFYLQAIEQLGASVYLLSFEIILGILVSLASSILIVYASIAIGHLFNEHKMLASFGAFILLSTLAQFFILLVSLIPGIAFYTNVQISSFLDFIGLQWLLQMVMAYGIIYAALLSAAFFAVTNRIISKRLNLE